MQNRVIGQVFAATVLVVAAWSRAAPPAVTLDFNDLPFMQQPHEPPYFGFAPPPETLVSDRYRSVGVVFGRPGLSAGMAGFRTLEDGRHTLVALDANGLLPGHPNNGGAYDGNSYFRFVVPGTDTPALAENVSFVVGDAGGDLDHYEIRGYGLDDALAYVHGVASPSYVTVTMPFAVQRVEVDFQDDFGYSLDDLSFTIVPEPAAVALLGGALATSLLRRPGRSA